MSGTVLIIDRKRARQYIAANLFTTLVVLIIALVILILVVSGNGGSQ